jgi:PEP-CTERM motif
MLTATAGRTVFTWDFSDVVAASVMENLGSSAPTVTATFDYRTVSEHISTVPEPSTWAMMLTGFAGLGFAGYWRREKLPPWQRNTSFVRDLKEGSPSGWPFFFLVC